MTQRINVDGICARVVNANLGVGGQGVAKLVELDDQLGTQMVLKELPYSKAAAERVEWACRRNFSSLSAAIAAPIVAETGGSGPILHLAPLAVGAPQDEDIPRPFPHNLQICLELACLLQSLEENGIVHGDIAPSNVLIAADGAVQLIDFDGFLSLDPNVPAPDTIGQRPMLAPEQRNGTHQTPTVESGYFQAAMLMSMILTGHFPTDGMPSEPAAVDRVLCQGGWPEHDRTPDPDDLPIEALGPEIVALFDRAFSLTPTDRPGPDEWRRVLTDALHNCWIHDCGQAFVARKGTNQCPGCRANLQVPSAARQLRIQVLPNGARYGVELKDGATIVLGRSTMPGLPPTVSGRQLEILPHKNKLLLRHVGRNPTLVQKDGLWYKLNSIWLPEQSGPIEVKLGDVHLSLSPS